MNSTNGSAKATVDILDIDDITVGEKLFESTSTCVVKVTRDGKETPLRFKIRSTAFAEVLDKIRDMQPHPPSQNTLVSWDSEMGRAIGVTREQGRRWVTTPNTNDEEYQRKLSEYNKSLTMETINQGLVVTLREKDGTTIPVSDRKRRIEALEGMGLTVHQFNQLSRSIDKLTEMSDEDRANFFGTDSVADSTPLSV